jgi:hypothetical protein
VLKNLKENLLQEMNQLRKASNEFSVNDSISAFGDDPLKTPFFND